MPHQGRDRIASEIARGLVALVVVTLCLGSVALGSPAWSAPGMPGSMPDFEAACLTENPYLAVVCYFPPGVDPGMRDQDAPAVVAFRDTPNNQPQVRLAAMPEVGAVWGLAFSGAEEAVYAAAYNKRQVAFGPGGSGAVYRIDLQSGQIAPFVTVPNAGVDRHAPGSRGLDRAARPWVSKSSLGGIDINAAGTEMAVMNLFDRRIYRFAIPGGALLGSFAHGAAGDAWAEDARPFALKIHADRLYHGVVDSAQLSRRYDALRAFVFESALDGSDMQQVAEFSLDYPRGRSRAEKFVVAGARLDWRPWIDTYRPPPEGRIVVEFPMPILSDIAFTALDLMVIGLRDRHSDAALLIPVDRGGATDDNEIIGFGLGDLLLGRPRGDRWEFQTVPETFADSADYGDESSQGGIAYLPASDVVANAMVGFQDNQGGGFDISAAGNKAIVWYDPAAGNKLRREDVCRAVLEQSNLPRRRAPRGRPLKLDDDAILPIAPTLGDVELLCADPLPPSPTATASATPTDTATTTPRPTPTPSPTRTPASTYTSTTAPTTTPTATPTAKPQPIYLPITLHEPPCALERPHIDVVLVLDASTSMLEPTRAGRSKLDAAREAARLFLDQLDLRGPPTGGAPGRSLGDQAAIVQFNAEARLLQPLTGDRAALRAALPAIQPAQFTRIDLGIRAGHTELASPRHRADHQPALIVLTDGRNNPEPVSSAIAAAAEAKAAGLRVYAIGLGEDVEADALRQMASRPGDYFAAPDGEDLAGIYRAIAGAVKPCPVYWPGRP